MSETAKDIKRLAEIRMRLMRDEADGVDISTWESPMFFRIIEEKNKEIQKLKRGSHEKADNDASVCSRCGNGLSEGIV